MRWNVRSAASRSGLLACSVAVALLTACGGGGGAGGGGGGGGGPAAVARVFPPQDGLSDDATIVAPDEIERRRRIEFVEFQFVVMRMRQASLLDEHPVSQPRLGGHRILKEMSGRKGKRFDHPNLRSAAWPYKAVRRDSTYWERP